MDAEQDFLREIEAVPDQDDTRLVFADWLEEQGNPRAEFIRLQCGAGDVSIGRDGKIRDLLHDHREEWLAPVKARLGPALAGQIGGFGFVRGFVGEVTLPGTEFVEHAPRLFEAIPLLESVCLTDVRSALARVAGSPWLARLRELCLTSTGLGNSGLQTLAESRHLRRLSALHLRQNGIGSPGIMALVRSGVPELKVLNLSGNVLGDGGLQALAMWSRFDQLAELDLADNHLSNGDAVDFFDRLARRVSQLGRLSLRSNQLHAEAAHALRRSAASLPQLVGLDLSQNPLGSDGAAALSEVRLEQVRDLNVATTQMDIESIRALVRAFPRLDALSLADNSRLGDAGVLALVELGLPRLALDLSGTGVGDAGLVALASTPHSLERLDLRNTLVGPDGIKHLLDASSPAGLRSLMVSGPNFGGMGTEALARAAQLAAIVSLRLEGPNVGSVGARRLSESPYLSALRRLHLIGAGVGSGGIRALASTTSLSHLRELSVAQCAIGDDGAEAIADSSRFSRLVSLDLSCNDIGDFGVRAIAQSHTLRHLTELNLAGNPCSDEAAEALLASPFLTRVSRLTLSPGAIGPRLQQALRRRFGARLVLEDPRHL